MSLVYHRLFSANAALALLGLLLAACSSPVAEAVPGPPDVGEDWYLTFESEFERPSSQSETDKLYLEAYDGIDPVSDNAKWEFRHGPNKEAYAVEENVFITNYGDTDTSVLALRTSHDDAPNSEFSNPLRTGYIRTRNYETSSDNDKMTFAQRYGYFEARVKLNTSPGQWFAFWLMPFYSTWCADSSGRDGTEIDIVEGFPRRPTSNKNRNQSVNFAIHYDGYRAFHQTDSYSFPSGGQRSQYASFDASEFHTYGFLWTPDKYVWFLNGHKVHEITNPDKISQVPKYIKLSTEVAAFTGTIDESLLPADTLVDWVRVWQTDTLAEGNPFIFELEDASRVARTKSTYTKWMTAGLWCRGQFLKAKTRETGRVTIPLDAPVQARQIGIRVSNPRDPSSKVELKIDGKRAKTWSAIDLDQIFVLKHVKDTEIKEELTLEWSGGIAIDQVYIVPSTPIIN